MNRAYVIVAFAAAGGVTAALELLLRDSAGASVILTVAFWKTISEGAVALAAIAELTRAKWVAPIKRTLTSLYPMILLTSLLMILLVLKFDLYPWTASPTLWMNKWAFLGRNLVVSIALFVLAWMFSTGAKEPRGRLIVVLLFVFVLSQTLFAFDIVMSLEYPWISTLFGGYFFIEAIFAGMAVAGVICFFSVRRLEAKKGTELSSTLRDVATLIFGFSLLWAGMFYSQFLVIWYGNIPEEAGFLVHRLDHSPVRELSHIVLGALFFVPFIVLISRRAKSSAAAVLISSLLVLGGILVERIVFLAPVAALNPGAIIPEFGLMLVLAGVLAAGRMPARKS